MPCTSYTAWVRVGLRALGMPRGRDYERARASRPVCVEGPSGFELTFGWSGGAEIFGHRTGLSAGVGGRRRDASRFSSSELGIRDEVWRTGEGATIHLNGNEQEAESVSTGHIRRNFCTTFGGSTAT